MIFYNNPIFLLESYNGITTIAIVTVGVNINEDLAGDLASFDEMDLLNVKKNKFGIYKYHFPLVR